MKPLLKKDLASFCSRFDNFVDAEIRSIEVASKDVIKVVIAVQDSNREYDWITVTLEFNNISDAKLIDDAKIYLLDMNDGLSIISSDNTFAFGIGNYDNVCGIKNAVSYIISSSIKYKEEQF